MSYKKVIKPNREDLRNMLLKSNNKQVALDLGVNTRTIQRWRDLYNLDHKSVAIGDHKMTDLQLDIIIGTLLGNASIGYHEPTHNARYSFSHNSDYLNKFIFDQLSPYTIQINEKFIYTIRCVEFTEMRKIWYKDSLLKKSKKTLPDIDFNKNHLFFWFIDNGFGNKEKNTITFTTNNNDVFSLNNILEKSLHIKGKIQQSKIVFNYDQIIDLLEERANSFDLMNIFNLRFIKSFKSIEEELEICNKRENNVPFDKILKDHNISRATMYRIVKKHSDQHPSGIKLKKADVVKIINLWNEGLSQKMIADSFKVSQTMISQIVNRRSRKNITKSIYIRNTKDKDKTSAIVTTVYNPKN